MRYLLDSHVFLWFDDQEKLSRSVRDLLDSSENELYFSVASIWELTLKRAAGKLHFTGAFATVAARYDIVILPIRQEHAAEVEQLPRFHQDPFDHMLVAQARVEGLMLVTHDEVLIRYPVTTLRV